MINPVFSVLVPVGNYHPTHAVRSAAIGSAEQDIVKCLYDSLGKKMSPSEYMGCWMFDGFTPKIYWQVSGRAALLGLVCQNCNLIYVKDIFYEVYSIAGHLYNLLPSLRVERGASVYIQKIPALKKHTSPRYFRTAFAKIKPITAKKISLNLIKCNGKLIEKNNKLTIKI